MITEEKMIRPLLPHEWAGAIAKETYAKWQDKNNVPAEKRVKFEDDLVDYLCNGFVLSRPTVFWMAKMVELTPPAPDGTRDLAWFVRVAAGNMEELMQTLPALLPKIAFCRRGDGRVRVYRLERFLQIVYRKRKLNLETRKPGKE
jgi:hypothetical protein